MESRTGPGMERHRADHISAVAIATETPKLQYSSSREASITQIPNCVTRGVPLDIEVWNFFESWSLEFSQMSILNVENGGCR
jgi:hypothetical protein